MSTTNYTILGNQDLFNKFMVLSGEIKWAGTLIDIDSSITQDQFLEWFKMIGNLQSRLEDLKQETISYICEEK